MDQRGNQLSKLCISVLGLQDRGMVHHSLAKGGLRRGGFSNCLGGGGGGEKVEGLKGGLKGGLRRGGFSSGLQGGF